MKRVLKYFSMSLICCVISLSCYNVFAFKATKPLLNCHKSDRITVAAVGDILLHLPLQRKASFAGFQSLWSEAIPYIQSADIAFANIEGPMAYGVSKSGNLIKDPGHRVDGQVYTSYPLFNYHPKLANALKRSGFDVVSTANNHALDRYSVGVDRTIKVLDNAKLNHMGTRTRNSDETWYTVTEKNGFKVAWLACTEGTNGITDSYHQVLHCYKKSDQKELLALIQELKQKVDAVIITPHWGKQYQRTVSKRQKRLAVQLLEAGATAIIGTHPHVVQPVKYYRTKDGRQTLVAYSLGNFVSYQGTPKNRSTIILYFSLVRKQNHVVVEDLGYIPAYMNNRSGLKNMHLSMLKSSDKKSVGYRILSHQLKEKYMLMGDSAFVQHFCETQFAQKSLKQ